MATDTTQTKVPTTTPTTTPTSSVPGNAAAAQDMVGQYIGKAREFAKARPAATAALAGVVGMAIFNTLRGRT